MDVEKVGVDDMESNWLPAKPARGRILGHRAEEGACRDQHRPVGGGDVGGSGGSHSRTVGGSIGGGSGGTVGSGDSDAPPQCREGGCGREPPILCGKASPPG